MALRQEYALANSRFNDFLFAVVGEEKSGQELTVLSAMARLGLNPWGEASSLSKLSKDAAARALEAMFAKLPKDGWQQSDLPSIAGRLVTYLPDRASNAKEEADESGKTGGLTDSANIKKLVFWAIFAAAITVAVINQFGS